MLTSTFCHIPRVGPKTEQRLWAAGATSWDKLHGLRSAKASIKLRDGWFEHAAESARRYEGGDPAYFARGLPASCLWRLYRDFAGSCAFVDIETTGLSAYADITTAVLYDGRAVRWYVRGRNLDDFVDDIAAYKVLVTYNGKCFDGPVLESRLGARLPEAHIDLRFVLGSLGHTGGLKGCERALGMGRPGMEDVDGFTAVLLWEEYQSTGDERVLETLLAYNVQDTLSLHALMVHGYNAKLRQTPFYDDFALAAGPLPANPFRADPAVLRRVAGRLTTAYSMERAKRCAFVTMAK